MITPGGVVVPRKGDVDRNRLLTQPPDIWQPSSPARGTWIEIMVNFTQVHITDVVPRKGDVDRNIDVQLDEGLQESRPPQGGRG